jgi:hypothetical protein
MKGIVGFLQPQRRMLGTPEVKGVHLANISRFSYKEAIARRINSAVLFMYQLFQKKDVIIKQYQGEEEVEKEPP